MNVGILLAGFSADEQDTAIPVQHYLMRELAKQDSVRVIALRYPHRRVPYRVFDAEVIPLGYTHKARRLRRFQLWAEALYRIHQLHREKPFDVLHAVWADETGLIAGWAGRLLNIPVVVSVVGGELVWLDDIRYGLQESAFSRWIVRQAISNADVIISACSYVDDLLAQIPYQPARLERVVMGVDTDLFSHTDHKPSSHKLIHVASLIPVKDQITLLQAMTHLSNEIILDIVGEGGSREMLENLAHELGIRDRVNFLGAVPHDQMPELYRKAALHVLSSRHEGLGMVTLEAAACGIPTVSTDVGLLPDYPDMGIVVSVGDAEAMANAIQNLLDHPEHYSQLSQSARQCVIDTFTISHTIRKYRTIYASLIR